MTERKAVKNKVKQITNSKNQFVGFLVNFTISAKSVYKYNKRLISGFGGCVFIPAPHFIQKQSVSIVLWHQGKDQNIKGEVKWQKLRL